MKTFESYLAAVEAENPFVFENATSGSTCAANVAGVVGGLGVGFNPDGDHGIYGKPVKKPLKKAAKTTIIRRT